MKNIFENVRIPSSAGIDLEGLITNGSSSGIPAVVLHPHPLYGGDMHNIVVCEAVQALAARNHPVLKFNFRGVGSSSGKYSGGGDGVEDCMAAMDFIERRSTQSRVIICGYSFGAWIAWLCARARNDITCMTLIAPPNKMFEFPPPSAKSKCVIIVGENDEFCDIALLKEGGFGDIEVIPGADHFFCTGMEELARLLTKE